MLHSALAHYKSLRRTRAIRLPLAFDYMNRSFIFDRRRSWEQPFLTGGALAKKLLANFGKKLFVDFHWSRDFASIHFIRTQRHYNKRRYARMRAVSRPSF